MPCSAVLDLLGNVYNTNHPAELGVARQLMGLKERRGAAAAAATHLPLDSLLASLVDECARGRCPLAPILAPRRALEPPLPH